MTNKSKDQNKFIPSPSYLHSVLVNEFCIKESLQEYLESYFILYWRGEYFISQMKEGSITHDGKQFIVVFDEGASRGKILANEDCIVAVSFRQAEPQFKLPAYVLVQISKSGKNL
jgi:hypothetical protein